MMMHRRSGRWFVPCAMLMALAACNAPKAPQSTRLTLEDFDHTVTEVTQQLLTSDFLTPRNGESPRVVITINQVRNLTSDVISPAEQWSVMGRVRSGLSVNAMRQKNVVFQITPERHELLRHAGFDTDKIGPANPPTHVMSGVFRSSTRAATGDKKLVDARTDLYFLEFTIESIQDRHTVWTGGVEFKREAAGLAID